MLRPMPLVDGEVPGAFRDDLLDSRGHSARVREAPRKAGDYRQDQTWAGAPRSRPSAARSTRGWRA
jgi:hypothetical protein